MYLIRQLDIPSLVFYMEYGGRKYYRKKKSVWFGYVLKSCSSLFYHFKFKTLSIDKDTCIYIFLIHNEKFFIKNIFGVGFNYRGEWGKYECKPYFKVFFEGSVGL